MKRRQMRVTKLSARGLVRPVGSENISLVQLRWMLSLEGIPWGLMEYTDLASRAEQPSLRRQVVPLDSRGKILLSHQEV